MHINLEDPYIVDKIVSEVKSQGVFDQFRKDCMSDVDTKPAYQNLRQRVEISVGKFLSEQVWTPDTNKIQLREKLRKHITETGFLETGVQRIVDQVVNPKIATTFQPKIEDIAYKYLGIEKPEENNETVPSCTNGNLQVEVDLMPTDLEAVSPDSDKGTNKSNDMNDSDDKVDDEEESPPFEPLEGRPPSPVEEKSNESKLSAISGLTSQDSVKSEVKSFLLKPTEECQLSQVSSSSHLSIVTTEDEENEISSKEQQPQQQRENDMSEEAQMPKFFENTDLGESKSLHFDIKKDEIKFEGTERGSGIHSLSTKNSMQIEMHTIDSESNQNSSSEFQNSLGSDNDSDKGLKIMTDISQSESSVLNLSDKAEESGEVLKDVNSGDDKSQLQSSEKNESHRKDNFNNTKDEKNDSSVDGVKNKKKSKYRDGDTKTNSRSSHKEHRSSRKDKHRSNSHKSKSHSNIDKEEKSSDNDNKQKQAKESKEKVDDDHYSSRPKITRKKSTDSNDDENNGHENRNSTIFSNTSNISTEPINNSKSDFSSNSESSNQPSNDKKSHSVGHHEQLQMNLKKPVIITDQIFNNNNIQDVEFAVGNKIISNCLRISYTKTLQNDAQYEKTNENLFDFEGFEYNSNDDGEFQVQITKLSEVIKQIEAENKNLYIICKDDNFIQALKNIPSKVINIEINSNTTNIANYKTEISKKLNGHKRIEMLDGNTPSNKTDSSIIKEKFKGKINGNVVLNNNKRKRLSESGLIIPQKKINNEQLVHNLNNDRVKNLDHMNKKLKLLNTESAVDSDSSIGSKENDCFLIPNTKVKSKSNEKQSVLVKSNQRYSNEDLYKPRSALSQRSKRRGIDTCDL